VVDEWYVRRHIGGSWRALAERADREGAAWASLLWSNVSALEALDALVAYPHERRHVVCHRDFDRSNLGLDGHGAVVVLDWDNAGPLVPELEVGAALVDFGSKDPTLASAFAEGYERDGRTFPREDWIFASTIAAHGNFIALMAQNALDDPGQRGNAWTEGVVTSILSSPITPEKLLALLEAVSTDHATGAG
jgi:aminoglycoside phosphotransferase (APT) family kinase protein